MIGREIECTASMKLWVSLGLIRIERKMGEAKLIGIKLEENGDCGRRKK
jgi:hypothetical protein